MGVDGRTFQVLIMCSMYIQSGTSVHEASPLALAVRQVADRRVVFRWEGMHLGSASDCELNFSANHTEIWTIMDYVPTNYTFTVPGLLPATFYKFILVCHDNTNGKHTSQPVNFTTANESYTVRQSDPNHSASSAPDMAASGGTAVTMTIPTVSLSSSSPSSSLSPYSLTRMSSLPTSSASPVADASTVTSRPPTRRPSRASPLEGGAVVEAETSMVDIGLGVAFGFIGCGVFAMMAYFCLKEYRRRLRIRRFLQYRQQENEAFPDMENDDDEGIVI